MQEHDGTKIAANRVAIDEQVIEGNASQILLESIDKQNVESCEGSKNVAGESKGENEREQVTEDSKILESVEQVPVNNSKDEEKEAKESTKEVSWTVNLSLTSFFP